MENDLYTLSSTFDRGSLPSSYSARLSSVSDRYAEASMIGSTRYSALERGYSSHQDGMRFPSAVIPGVGGAAAGNITDVDGFGTVPGAVSGMKRPAEALYHQTIPGTQNIGQTEALFSTYSLVKHPRLDSANPLHNYPLRPGMKDCAYYMRTRTCNFGVNCKFDHPLWVPEGGIPEWKEITVNHESENLPERPGEPDCPYFMKTQRCKYGSQCKFSHPKGKLNASLRVVGGEDVQVSQAGQKSGSAQLTELAVKDYRTSEDSQPAKTFVPFAPALLHNSKGLPIRLGETSCPFYLKTGSCKYGATCRYNHPELNNGCTDAAINPQVPVTLGQAAIPPLTTSLPFGVLHTSTNLLPNIDPRVTQTLVAVNPTIYPQRPGQLECDFYMKTGQCKFGERCKFHHPVAISAQAQEPTVKLTLAGFPRREGASTCSYYMKTGTCKYGANCRFDHPPPGESIAMATGQGQENTAGNETEPLDAPGEEDAAGAA